MTTVKFALSLGGFLMLNVFSWIRNSVRQAVLAGIADAVETVTTGNVTDGDERLGRLLAGPKPVDLDPSQTQGGRTLRDVTPPAEEADASTNGRSRGRKAVQA